jgi:hypothetical protein
MGQKNVSCNDGCSFWQSESSPNLMLGKPNNKEPTWLPMTKKEEQDTGGQPWFTSGCTGFIDGQTLDFWHVLLLLF